MLFSCRMLKNTFLRLVLVYSNNLIFLLGDIHLDRIILYCTNLNIQPFCAHKESLLHQKMWGCTLYVNVCTHMPLESPLDLTPLKAPHVFTQ